MKKISFLLASVLTIAATSFAQVSEKESPAKQAENKEIREANQLRKSFEQKQLNSAPETLADSSVKAKAATRKTHCKNKRSSKSSTSGI